jgi:fimbrial chaperone protein
VSSVRFVLKTLVVAAALGLPSLPAAAGSFSSFGISPVRVDLSAAATTAALTVRSDGASPTVVQAQAFVWEQQDGTDQLSPTHDLIVSPAVFTLSPGGSQLLRVALRRAADADRELSYRLILTEVPPKADPQFSGLAVALRLSLPVFVSPAAPVRPDVHWSAARSVDGHLMLTARNDGRAHFRALSFSVGPATGSAAPIQQPVATYLLPGESHTWVFDKGDAAKPMPADWSALKLTGLASDGPIEAEISLAPE